MNEDPHDPKRTKVRLPIRAGVVVALFAGAVGVLHTRFAAGWIVQDLVAKADAAGLAVSTSGLQYNLISGHVQIDNLVLRVKSSPNAFFAARKVEGKVSFFHLRNGLAALSQVSVTDGTFRMQVDPSGHSNVDFGSTGSSPAPGGFPAHVTMRGMHFLYEDGTTYVDQPDLNLEFRDGLWAGHSAAPGHVRVASTRGTIASFRMSGEERGVTLRDIRLHVQAEASNVQFGDGAPATLHVSAELLGSDNALAFTQIEARSSKGVLAAHGLLPFDDKTGSVAFGGRYDAVAVNGSAEWAGTNYDTYRGQADVRSYRNDLQGDASVRFNAEELQAQVRRVSGYGVNATGVATLKLATSALTGRLQGKLPDLRTMTNGTVSGHGDFLASLGGTLKAPAVTVAVSSTDLAASSLHSIHATARGRYQSGRVQITDVQAEWQGQVVHAAGELIVTHTPCVMLALRSDGLDARTLTSAFVSTPIEGQVNVVGNVTGVLASPIANFQLNAQNLAARSESLGDLKAQITLDSKKLLLQDARLHKNAGNNDGVLQADGSYDFSSEETVTNLSATAFPLEGSFIGPRLGHPVTISGTSHFHGQMDALSGDASMILHDEQNAEVKATVHAVDGNATASLDSSDLQIALPGGTARGAIAVEASGALSRLESATASATVRNFSFQTPRTTVSADGPVHMSWQNQGLEVVRATFHDGGGSLNVQGRLGLEESSDHLVVQGSAPVALMTAFRPDVAIFHPEGTLRVDASVSGSLLQRTVRGSLHLNGGSLQIPGTEEPIRDLEANLSFKGESLELKDLAAKLGTGTLSLIGHADALRGPFATELTISDVDPTLLFHSRLPQLTSKISGTATLSGATTSALDDLDGSAQLSALELKSPAGNASQERPIVASLRHGVLRVDESSLISKYGRVRGVGTYDLRGQHALSGSVDGVIDTSFLNLDPNLHLSGPLTANLTVAGTADAPELRGVAEMHGGAFSFLRPLRLNADRVDLHAVLEGSSVRMDRMNMDVNGGSVHGSGSLNFGDGAQHGKLAFAGEDVFLNYPEGLTSASDFDLHLSLGDTTPELKGKITVNDSAYRRALDITRLSRPAPPGAGNASGTFASKLQLDVAVETDQPLTIDNNLGRLTADAKLHLQGTLQQPGVTGGLQLEDGGQVNFAGRNFRIDQGRVDFTSANRIEPRFNLQAESTIGSYLVTLKVNGDEKNLDTSFQSEPSLSQDQILSLLFTGSPDNGTNSNFYAQSQLVSLLGSTVGGSFFTTVRNTLRLNEFRIDPRLIAADQNPTARLTVGEAFTPSFRMTYSTDLTNAQDQVWTAEYDWRKRFLARFYRDSDQSNRAEIRQKFRFGGGPLTGDYAQHPAHRKLVVRNVVIEGDPIFDPSAIRKRLHLKVGRKYDTFRSQRDVTRLLKFYVAHGYAEVRVHSHRLTDGDGVSLSYNIDAGPPVVFQYESKVDTHTRKVVLAKWQEGLTDAQRTSDVEQLLQDSLRAKRYPSADSKVLIHQAQGKKVVVIDARSGDRYQHPEIAMPGIAKGEQAALRASARRSNTDIQGELHPELLTEKLTTQLHADGYLAAAVETTVQRAAPEAGSLRVMGTTGPHFVVGTVTFEGNTRLSAQVLRSSLYVESGDVFRDDLMQVVATRVQQRYWEAGFRDAHVTCDLRRDDVAGKVNLVVSVAEGPESTLGSLSIAGLSQTSDAFLKRRLNFTLHAPLAGSAVSQSRRNLLDSGAYNMVDFTFKPTAQTPTDQATKPLDLLVTVREPKPYRIDFGATYDTDRGFGGIADLSVVNKLGEARTLGFRLAADSQAQDYRVYFSQPFLGRRRVISTASLFAQHEQISIFDGYDQGLSLQHDLRFRKNWNTTYGYQFEHVTVDVKNLGELFNETKSNFVGTISRDSRDKPLDAAKGTFFSAASEYGPHQLGGSIGYFRAYAQASAYVGLLHPRPLPFEETRRRSRLVLATNARAGVVNNIGDVLLIPTDLFFAGGGTSIRGFSQNSVGPVDSSGSAVGGKVTMIFNNELRFPLYKFVDGVAFVDNGNVWKQPGDVRFTDLRTGAGAGLRVRNPFVLIRLDYGLKVNRQPGESRGAFFFSIGQTF